MKISKTFSIRSSDNIWRLLLSNSEKIALQTMNAKTREVSFHCYDFSNGKEFFKNIQFREKFFIGIEAFHNDIIYFHKYGKPEMPNHKGIAAYSINQKEILWESEDLEFYFLTENSIVARKQMYDSWKYFIIDPESGENIITDEITSKTISELSEKQVMLQNYFLPINFNNIKPEKISAIQFIEDEMNEKEIIGYPEYLLLDELLIFNYHCQKKNKMLDNHIFVIDLVRRKVLYSDKINSDLAVFVPDSFFVKDDFIFILKNGNEVNTLRIK